MPATTYFKVDRVKSCRLTKADLVRLARLVTEHATGPTARVYINTRIGDTNIAAETIDAFLAHSELPPVLTVLSISARSEAGNISADIGGLYGGFSVEGTNEVWVRGSYDRLQAFFKEHQRFEPPKVLASPLLVSLAVGGALTLVVQLMVQQQLLAGFIASVASAFLLLRYISWAFFRLKWPAQIILVDKPPFWRGIFTQGNLANIIAVIGIIVAIVLWYL